MSGQGRLSLWSGNPALDSWYNAAIGRNASPRNMDETDMEEVLFFDIAKSNQVKYPSDGANDWFYGATMGDGASIETHDLQPAATSPTLNCHFLARPGLESSTLTSDKPLSQVHDSPTSFAPKGGANAYFDYIFADAGLESQVKHGQLSPDNVSFEVDNGVVEHEMSDDNYADQASDTPPPEHFTPATPDCSQDAVAFHRLDDSGFTTHAFLQVGISISSKELTENYRAIASTDTNSHFSVNPTDEAEKAVASAGFFGGFAAEEFPSPYHAPVTDRSSGFGDIREGAEVFPQQWQDNERRPMAYTLEEANAIAEEYLIDIPGLSTRPIRMPASRKVKAAKSRNYCRNSPTVIDLTSDNSSEHESSGTGKKRKVHDSFITKSFFDTSSRDGDDVQYLYAKKARVVSNGDNDAEVEIARRPSTYSLTTIPDPGAERMSTNSEASSSVFTKIEPAPVGYPGQFCRVMTGEQAMRNYLVPSQSPGGSHTVTMGDYLHPNYLFTHTNFYPCPHEDKLDYRPHTVRPRSQIARSLDYADELSTQAADTQRTAAEEALRREVHHECAWARLEGVSIGQYRYYQGHLNIEEYNEAGMCICWEACECSKLCTRFADLLCPCSQYIEIHKL